MKVYAFDVDHTLVVSSGPIGLDEIYQLHEDGHITGLCGNWAMVTGNVSGWQKYISFLGPIGLSKADFLKQLAMYVDASEYVMVGNDGSIDGHSQDAEAARLADWRFISEARFAAGER